MALKRVALGVGVLLLLGFKLKHLYLQEIPFPEESQGVGDSVITVQVFTVHQGE